jgi:hypothetical protein
MTVNHIDFDRLQVSTGIIGLENSDSKRKLLSYKCTDLTLCTPDSAMREFFCDFTQRRMVVSYQRFGKTYLSLLQGEAVQG